MDERLEAAFEAGDLTALAELIAAGVEVNAPDRFGARPLGRAILVIDDEDLRLQAVEMLLAAGADPTLLTEGSGPLFACVIQKDARVLQILLERGADPNAEHDDGEPLYDWARFDYFFDEWWYVNGRWEDEWPEEPTEADWRAKMPGSIFWIESPSSMAAASPTISGCFASLAPGVRPSEAIRREFSAIEVVQVPLRGHALGDVGPGRYVTLASTST